MKRHILMLLTLSATVALSPSVQAKDPSTDVATAKAKTASKDDGAAYALQTVTCYRTVVETIYEPADGL